MLPDAATPVPGEPAMAMRRWSALVLDGYERSMKIGHGGQELCSSTCVSAHDALTGLLAQGDHLPTHAANVMVKGLWCAHVLFLLGTAQH